VSTEEPGDDVMGMVTAGACVSLLGVGLVFFIIDQTGPNPTPTETYVDACVDGIEIGVAVLQCLACFAGAAPQAATASYTAAPLDVRAGPSEMRY
jgi:hypothetical protein